MGTLAVLAAETELRDDLAIALDVIALEVFQEAASSADHLEQTPT